MLHPPRRVPGTSPCPRREQVRLSQQGECGVYYAWGGSRFFLNSMTPLRTLSKKKRRIYSIAFSWNKLGAPERRRAVEAGCGGAFCACAGFPWRRDRESETPPGAPQSPVPCGASAPPFLLLPGTFSLLIGTRNQFVITFLTLGVQH